MNLRARLAWIYAVAFAAAVAVFALVSVASVDRALRRSLDERLTTAASAVTALVDVHHGKISFDAEDRLQMQQALAGAMEGAVFGARGDIIAQTTSAVPAAVREAAREARGGLARVRLRSGVHDLRAALDTVSRGNDVFGVVAVWQSSDFIDEFDRDAAIVMLLAALALGAVVAALSSSLARRALAPLERFTEVATEIEAHDLSRRIGGHGSDELGRLGSAFDRMLDRLEAAFARQRQFTADASHELRAPLAVMRAETDVALAKERGAAEYRAALATVAGEVERIDALVGSLLVAARADSARLQIERADVGEIVLLAVERFRPTAASRGIAIATDVSDEALVDGDALALDRAFAAVLHNALDFAASEIRVAVSAAANGIEVSVTDDGLGFSDDALAHGTERFWRGDPARRRGSSGLGLSIAEAIVRAHGGSITLTNVAPHGARVLVTLRSSARHLGEA
ncbi:MAG: HAMP domain-containing protein [bacterium]|nr:HAMP domain-containing protein [bacterium]